VPELGARLAEALAPEARALVLAALPAGLAREARLDLTVTADEGFETMRLERARTGLVVEAGPGGSAAAGRGAARRRRPASRMAFQRVELDAWPGPAC
jgi:hypothetical protein